ncbi:hypothetical protein MKL09_10965 [Methylobacterium sp. J-048]|uniref:hypothetical protein n=1 Tax=Methylobacterium sp. J-048 TaxID=2836635 RepID=UPI001FBB3BCA|nr:hypothetical protein [Methylobacterium sp. J-048]MCJ2057075.1 hypothetical protein [Methylobacterium sp. J-048]
MTKTRFEKIDPLDTLAADKPSLSLDMHEETNPVIREKIIRHCVPEYPFLGELLRI